jgi:hypothetical protein
MNLDYLQKQIIPLRKKEIEKGKNLATRQPIYVVLDLQEHFVSGHSDYSSYTNNRGKVFTYGYIDESLDSECRQFKVSEKRMKSPSEVTRFYTDRIVAFFLTSKGAHDYLKYQKHNLSNAYVYVFYSGYANKEMDALLNGN